MAAQRVTLGKHRSRPAAELPLASDPPASGLRAEPLPDESNFPTLYEEYFPLVWRTARRMGVPAASLDDVCQEVFLAIHRRLPYFTGRSSVRTWIFGFVLNIVQVHHRSQRRKSVSHRAVGELLDPDTLTDNGQASADERMRSAEAVRMARQALEEIPAEKRAVFVMAELEGLTAGEIARGLDINVNTVYARLRSARRHFQRLVRRKALGPQ
jgi:RNA polymerase sigma-70 factor (ECF subfamily)